MLAALRFEAPIWAWDLQSIREPTTTSDAPAYVDLCSTVCYLFERNDEQLHCLTSCDHTLFWQAPNSWSKLPCNTAPDTPSHPASQMWQVNLEEQELWLVV